MVSTWASLRATCALGLLDSARAGLQQSSRLIDLINSHKLLGEQRLKPVQIVGGVLAIGFGAAEGSARVG